MNRRVSWDRQCTMPLRLGGIYQLAPHDLGHIFSSIYSFTGSFDVRRLAAGSASNAVANLTLTGEPGDVSTHNSTQCAGIPVAWLS